MNVHVVNTGTELLLGSVINTHLAFIAREIFPLGLRVDRQITVPDGSAISQALAESLRDAEIVFVTGGLGPTTDDITRETAAELVGVELRQDAAVAAKIAERLRVRGFPMTNRILRQADVPEGARVLPNENGTAPGLYMSSGGVHLFLLPGPPSELQPMFRELVVPILREIVPARAVEFRTFRLTGVGESMVEAAVGQQLLTLPGIELGYCARAGEVDVRVLGSAQVVAEAEQLINAAFPTSIYTTADEQLEEVVVRLLAERGDTIATAESCTGGYLAHRLTNVPGASAIFPAGFVTYSNGAKLAELGVKPSIIEEHGAVSVATARAMAEGARRVAGTTYALSTTGIAGPSGGSEEKPVGTVYIALAIPDAQTEVIHRRFLADRESFKRLTTQHALELSRQRLIATPAR